MKLLCKILSSKVINNKLPEEVQKRENIEDGIVLCQDLHYPYLHGRSVQSFDVLMKSKLRRLSNGWYGSFTLE